MSVCYELRTAKDYLHKVVKINNPYLPTSKLVDDLVANELEIYAFDKEKRHSVRQPLTKELLINELAGVIAGHELFEHFEDELEGKNKFYLYDGIRDFLSFFVHSEKGGVLPIYELGDYLDKVHCSKNEKKFSDAFHFALSSIDETITSVDTVAHIFSAVNCAFYTMK